MTPNQLIPCPVRASALRSPHAIAIKTANQTLTYAQFDSLIDRVKIQLITLGVKSGDKIAVISENSTDLAALIHVSARLGSLLAIINIRWHDREIDSALSRVSPELIISSNSQSGRPLQSASNRVSIEEITSSDIATTAAEANINLDDEATILFTSGSSGKPKGVVLTNGNHYYNALGSNENISLGSDDTWLLSLPLYHAGGISILHRCALAGASVCLHPFEAQSVSKLIDDGEISHHSLVPTMLKTLIDFRGGAPFPKSLKAILLGGAGVPTSLLSQIRQMSIPVLTSYGLTETASQLCTIAPTDSPDRRGTSGKPLKYRQVQILDEQGSPLPAGSIGEIAASGAVLFKRYLDAETSMLSPSGQFLTGDLGFLDVEGYLTVIGRKDEMFISGGENIYPFEIESVAETFAEISGAKVIAIDDDIWGKRPLLFVETPHPEAFNIEPLRQFLQTRLAKYKLPDKIIPLKSFPRTTLNKIDKQQLKRDYFSA